MSTGFWVLLGMMLVPFLLVIFVEWRDAYDTWHSRQETLRLRTENLQREANLDFWTSRLHDPGASPAEKWCAAYSIENMLEERK